MPKALRFHPEVSREVDEALDYGLKNWPDRVADLLDEYDARVAQICAEDTELRREIGHGVKRINLRRFPYHIIYLPWKGSIYIVAFCHSSQHPDYWMDRLS